MPLPLRLVERYTPFFLRTYPSKVLVATIYSCAPPSARMVIRMRFSSARLQAFTAFSSTLPTMPHSSTSLSGTA